MGCIRCGRGHGAVCVCYDLQKEQPKQQTAMTDACWYIARIGEYSVRPYLFCITKHFSYSEAHDMAHKLALKYSPMKYGVFKLTGVYESVQVTTVEVKYTPILRP